MSRRVPDIQGLPEVQVSVAEAELEAAVWVGVGAAGSSVVFVPVWAETVVEGWAAVVEAGVSGAEAVGRVPESPEALVGWAVPAVAEIEMAVA